MGNPKCEIEFDPSEVRIVPLTDLRDTRLFYEIYGSLQPSRPPVVLLHGLGSCSLDWELQLPALTETRRVMVVDLRGHGQSAPIDRRIRVRDLAGDVADLARDLGLGPAHWVGLSLGALVALQAAAHVPEQIGSLMVSGAFGDR